MKKISRAIAFLDRDGTLNITAPGEGYVTRPEDLHLLTGAAAAVRRLNDAGVTVVIVTNQRGVALERMTEADLDAVHERLRGLLAAEAGARVDLILYCPHHRRVCDCRKPRPGMLEAAAQQLGAIDKHASVIIGDALTDMEAGEAFGVKGILLGRDAADLDGAVLLYLSSLRTGAGAAHSADGPVTRC